MHTNKMSKRKKHKKNLQNTPIPVPVPELATYTHTCPTPSCGATYNDTDPEQYFCPVCIRKRKQIAAEIDRKLGTGPRKHQRSSLQAFESQGKSLTSNTSNTQGTATFIKIKL